MLKRKIKTKVRVTFALPAQEGDETMYLAGDFNDWDTHATPLARTREGKWQVELNLKPNREYQFRYFANGTDWRNDPAADSYVTNPHGSQNSVVTTLVERRIK